MVVAGADGVAVGVGVAPALVVGVAVLFGVAVLLGVAVPLGVAVGEAAAALWTMYAAVFAFVVPDPAAFADEEADGEVVGVADGDVVGVADGEVDAPGEAEELGDGVGATVAFW